MNILIVESNTPDIVDTSRAVGRESAAGHYANVLWLHDPDLHIQIAEPYRDAFVIADEIDAVVFTGSGVAWSTDAPEAAPLRAAAELVFNAGIPVLGSCNGLQLAATMLGGAVGASENGLEIGMAVDIQINADGQEHPMLVGRRSGYAVPCVHRDVVTVLPVGGVVLAGNQFCDVQALVIDSGGVDFWGVQYHPELPPSAVADYVGDDGGLFASGADLAADLRVAKDEPAAARRLGVEPRDLDTMVRSTEVGNWLQHIYQQASRSNELRHA